MGEINMASNPSYKAVRYGLNSKPIFIPVDKEIHLKGKKDVYESLYLYKQEHVDKFKEVGTVAGITDTIANKLYFDFDSKTDLNLAKSDALSLINTLESYGLTKENYRVCFTGAKGFSIEIPLDTRLDPKEFKELVYNLADGLETFDKVVTDANRIVRVVNSKHQETGLYKIPLTKDELIAKSVEEIKLAATEPREYGEKKAIKLEGKLLELSKPKPVVEKPKVISSTNYDVPPRPKGMDNVRWHLHNGIFGEGERHNAFLALTAYYKSLQRSKKETYYQLKCVADEQAERNGVDKFDKKELYSIVDSVFSGNWKGGTFSLKDPNSWLYQYAKKYEIPVGDEFKPISFSDLGGESFKQYAKAFYDNRIFTGLEQLDRDFPITAGSNIGIVAPASAGKTAFSLNVLRNLKAQGSIAVFASLDMSRSRLYEKLLYSVTEGKMTREQLFDEYINGNGAKYDAMVKEQFPTVYIYSKSGPSVDEMRDYILEIEEFTGKPVNLLMIDYFERLSSSKTDETSASKDIANNIQDLISDFPRLATITLFQPNKLAMNEGPDKPILNYTAIKGSSFIISSCRQILSISRPFFRADLKEYDDFMQMNIIKNDLGELNQYTFNWVGKTGSITKMSADDEIKYRNYMDIKNRIDSGEDEEDDKGYNRKSKWDL